MTHMRIKLAYMIIIFLFSIVAGCVGSPVLTPAPIPSVVPDHGNMIYINNSYNFSIQYPVNWTLQESRQDIYSYPSKYDINIVTFYPPMDNKSSKYDSFSIVYSTSLKSSDPLTLDDYWMIGLKYYYEEKPYINVISKNMTTLNGHPAIQTNFTYVYYGVKLKGMTIFMIGGNNYIYNGKEWLYEGKIYRLEYIASEDTFNYHLDEVERMISSFKFK